MRRVLLVILILVVAASSTVFSNAAGVYGENSADGYLKDITKDNIVIEDYDGTIQTYTYDSKTAFMIDQRITLPVDFKPGLEVHVELKDMYITEIDGYSTEKSGYIPEGSRVASGTIQKIDRDQIIVKLPTGNTAAYFTTPATIALKNSVNVSLGTLYEGDRVRLFFDEADTSFISRIQIEGDSVVVKDIYRGKLSTTDLYDNKITLGSVEVYRNGAWTPVKSSMSFPYLIDTPVYIAGQKISYKNLKYFTGKTVYMAVKDFFGKDRIEKMVLRDQYESAYSDKIDNVNWYTGAIELANHKNISFNEGTIIIKNGRLVDQYAINPQSDAFVAADGRGTGLIADVVCIYNEDINNSNIGLNSLYAGRLDEILQDKVYLSDFFLLNKNDWESFSDTKELYYDEDTGIYDLEAGRKITANEFYTKDYAVDEDSGYTQDNNLKDWYGYVYTDGDRIAGIMVQKNMDTLLRQRVTTGTIGTVTNDSMVGWVIDLSNGADWSSRNEKWMGKTEYTRINIEKAMIIHDGKVIQQEELKSGDRLYMVRDDFDAKVIIVK